MSPLMFPLQYKSSLTVQWLPGFGLPYDDWGHNEGGIAQAMSAVMGWDHTVLTVREKCMLFFMNQITDKPGWHLKVHDPEIIAKWRVEADELDWDAEVIEEGDMSIRMFSYVGIFPEDKRKNKLTTL